MRRRLPGPTTAGEGQIERGEDGERLVWGQKWRISERLKEWTGCDCVN